MVWVPASAHLNYIKPVRISPGCWAFAPFIHCVKNLQLWLQHPPAAEFVALEDFPPGSIPILRISEASRSLHDVWLPTRDRVRTQYPLRRDLPLLGVPREQSATTAEPDVLGGFPNKLRIKDVFPSNQSSFVYFIALLQIRTFFWALSLATRYVRPRRYIRCYFI